MGLFQKIDFVGNSGLPLDWKIECDALELEDWETLAYLVSKRYKFGTVLGIPRGGITFASCLTKYIDESSNTLLIVDDVLTTGGSMIKEYEKQMSNGVDDIVCVVAFSRGHNYPEFIYPLFQIW